MPTRDSNLSHFSNYPTWKVDLWRQISKDAKTRGAFLPEHYDNDGFLKHDLESYKGLFQWWLRQKDAATYQYLVPMWEHHRHGRWELYLVDTDAWTPVVALDAEKAIAGKAGARRKLPAGGMTINGLEPSNGLGEDVDFVDDCIGEPGHEGLTREVPCLADLAASPADQDHTPTADAGGEHARASVRGALRWLTGRSSSTRRTTVIIGPVVDV